MVLWAIDFVKTGYLALKEQKIAVEMQKGFLMGPTGKGTTKCK